MIHTEFSWMGTGNINFFAQEWKPETSPRAVIILSHGLGEHCGRYQHVAEHMVAAGFAVLALDHRGHGKTGGKRGHASFKDMVLDVNHLIEEANKRYPDTPKILYGHSMGGCLVLYHAISQQPNIAGVISTSPGLAPAQDPGSKLAFGRIIASIYPSFPMENGLLLQGLSHDANVIKAYQADPLVHSKISARLGLDIIDNGKWVIENAEKLTLPLLLIFGSEDLLVSPAATREFAAKIKNQATVKEWSGGYHELHNEPFKEDVIQMMIDWINSTI